MFLKRRSQPETPEEPSDDNGTDLDEFIKEIARALVDNPDDVDLCETRRKNMIVYELRVNKEDMGKVIGRGGNTVKAIRILVGAVAAKRGRRATLEILE